MDINLAIGIVSLFLSIVFFFYGLYLTNKSRQEKRLVYELLPSTAIADVIGRQSSYSLRVVYLPPEQAPIILDRAFVHYLRFTNLGRVPITLQDLAVVDPLRIEITDSRVLDVSLASVTREVCQVRLGSVVQHDGKASVSVEFEFLDYEDGALLQILTDAKTTKTSLQGTVVGMPRGIGKPKEVSERQPKELKGAGCIVWLVIQVAMLASVPFLYRYITGSWANVWLLLLPVGVIFIPWGLVLLSLFIPTARTKFKFPEILSPPDWYQERVYGYPGRRRMSGTRSSKQETDEMDVGTA